jgi:hypothetical protein
LMPRALSSRLRRGRVLALGGMSTSRPVSLVRSSTSMRARWAMCVRNAQQTFPTYWVNSPEGQQICVRRMTSGVL